MVAIQKKKLETYHSMNHDVVSAMDMKSGLDSHNGLKGTLVAVVKSNPADRMEHTKITDISRYTNFTYEGDGMIRVHRAYAVGRGMLINVKKQQDLIGPMNPIEEKEGGFLQTKESLDTTFTVRERPGKLVKRLCPHVGCTAVLTPEELETHTEHIFGELKASDLKGLERCRYQWGQELFGEDSHLRGKSVYQVSCTK